jgi:1-acyl-sn-glycerol-3-phosphate acyltransferase
MIPVFILIALMSSLGFIIISFFDVSPLIGNKIISFWAMSTMWIFGVQTKSFGKIPEGPCLYLFNHTSFFDIFALQAAVPALRFGAKIELFAIPFFGRAMRRAGVLPIARKQRQTVMKVYEEAQNRAKAGQQFALSPEGTRQVNEMELAHFKAGPFIFAINSQIPIVPVVIKNAAQVLGKKELLPNIGTLSSEIEVHFLDPIPVAEFSIEQRGLLQNQVRRQMEVILKNSKEFST